MKTELEQRFGSLAKKSVKVYFYGEKDLDTSNLDNATITKLLSNGFAVTEDGTVWINKEHVDSGKVIDFNMLTQHEISHIVFGEDSEFQAQYVEKAYGEFLQGIRENGYLEDNQGIIDYKMSMLVDEDWMRLNGYSFKDMQYRMLVGDDRVDRKVHLNPLSGEVIFHKEVNRANRLVKAYKRIDERIAKDKKITKIKNKDTVSKSQNRELIKKTNSIYDKKLEKAEAEEKYLNVRAVNDEEMRYLDYIQNNPNTRHEYKDYSFIVVGKDKDGRVVILETLGNTENKVSIDELYKNSYRTDLNNYYQKGMKDFIKDTDEGRAVASYGIILSGYGPTTESAILNREHKGSMLLGGLLDIGKGTIKARVGGEAVSLGAGLCYVGGCSIGVQLIGLGTVEGGIGLNNIATGIQKIEYGFSDRGLDLKGKTGTEYYSQISSGKATDIGYYEVYNPIGSLIKTIGGTEQDYVVLDMTTDLYLPHLPRANRNQSAASDDDDVILLKDDDDVILFRDLNSKREISVNEKALYNNVDPLTELKRERRFFNDGTPGGTVELNSVTVGNSQFTINKISSPDSYVSFISVLNKRTGEVKSRYIRNEWQWGNAAETIALTQIGKTAGFDLVKENIAVHKSIIPRLYYDVSVGISKLGTLYDTNGYLTRPIYGGTTVIGAGTNPVKEAYNIDIYPNPAIGVYYGNANNLNNIMNGTQSRVIAENPYGYSPYNSEINNILQTGGVLRITGSLNNRFFNRGYDGNINNIGYKEIITKNIIPNGYSEIIEAGKIPINQQIQGYKGNGGTGDPIDGLTEYGVELKK